MEAPMKSGIPRHGARAARLRAPGPDPMAGGDAGSMETSMGSDRVEAPPLASTAESAGAGASQIDLNTLAMGSPCTSMFQAQLQPKGVTATL